MSSKLCCDDSHYWMHQVRYESCLELYFCFAEIGSPERGRPYATEAKQALSDLTFGRLARVVEGN